MLEAVKTRGTCLPSDGNQQGRQVPTAHNEHTDDEKYPWFLGWYSEDILIP